ncbi:hypothetical protein [Novosphingobium album (ex Liu et al. 2023)]|uniref:DUF3108 domain-containing protein n=1 Tax=Novosphingobium album (ex Liu et al. 2023) TaxID=3031130 RepID=A0ABT5WJK1_9SPHN|nr:hypothetical protein [Novosphingobium album (ex Liu et al. 2023)]
MRTVVSLLGAIAAFLLLLAPAGAWAGDAADAALAGVYDGGQMELAARLELGADGRYRYALSYGAVDEASARSWTREEGGIALTSDASTPPAFEYLGDTGSSGGSPALKLVLDVPDGLPRPLFSAVVTLADGATFAADFAADGLEIPLAPGEDVASVALALPVFAVRGEPVAVRSARGRTLRFAFHANDLGFVAFDHAMLPIEDGALVLERFDRRILFRKAADPPTP